MKLVAANVRHDALDELVTALAGTRASGVTMSEVRVYSGEPTHVTYRGTDVPVGTIRTRIEIVVEDEGVEEVLRAIVSAGRRWSDDERAFVLPVSDSYRIRTGDWEGEFTK